MTIAVRTTVFDEGRKVAEHLVPDMSHDYTFIKDGYLVVVDSNRKVHVYTTWDQYTIIKTVKK